MAQVRVIDESGQDYPYPKSFVMEMRIPTEVDCNPLPSSPV